ncbi:MAG: nuclear transport factor 2 family protein, partial [Gemmatimonadales bacterium]
KYAATIALVGVAVACAPSGEQSAATDPVAFHAAVDSLLTASEDSWNGGDLDGFLYWYKRGEETSFMGAVGPIYGWETIRSRYAPRFELGAKRDSLRFEGLQTRPLAPWLGLATARYVLFQADSISSQGIFTLVLERTAEGWRIIHDHSSEIS